MSFSFYEEMEDEAIGKACVSCGRTIKTEQDLGGIAYLPEHLNLTARVVGYYCTNCEWKLNPSERFHNPDN